MWQASFKCETPRLELKSLRSFLGIKRCQGTKSKKVSKLAQSSLIKVAHICANRVIPVKGPWCRWWRWGLIMGTGSRSRIFCWFKRLSRCWTWWGAGCWQTSNCVEEFAGKLKDW
jgi:hypothetical protein